MRNELNTFQIIELVNSGTITSFPGSSATLFWQKFQLGLLDHWAKKFLHREMTLNDCIILSYLNSHNLEKGNGNMTEIQTKNHNKSSQGLLHNIH